MAVYKRTYKTYSGPDRSLVALFDPDPLQLRAAVSIEVSGLFLGACLFYPVGCLAFIYFSHNGNFWRCSAWAMPNCRRSTANSFTPFAGSKGTSRIS